MDEDNYQTFLKIVAWEDFHRLCNKRKFGRVCAIMPGDEYKGCTQADKETMVKCPAWKLFRNFYNGKVFQAMKRGEVHGGCIQKTAVKERHEESGQEYRRVPRRQLRTTG